jgi:Ras-related protein Rab-6A
MTISLKAVIIGDTHVGKTSIYHRLESDAFTPDSVSTIGATRMNLNVAFDDSEGRIILWDTAGQETFRSLVPLYFQGSSLVLLVCSVTARATLANLEMWHTMAKQYLPAETRFFLIGNKSDLANEREVTFSEGNDMAVKLGAVGYFETSAATGIGCEYLFDVFRRALHDAASRVSHQVREDMVAESRDCC